MCGSVRQTRVRPSSLFPHQRSKQIFPHHRGPSVDGGPRAGANQQTDTITKSAAADKRPSKGRKSLALVRDEQGSWHVRGRTLRPRPTRRSAATRSPPSQKPCGRQRHTPTQEQAIPPPEEDRPSKRWLWAVCTITSSSSSLSARADVESPSPPPLNSPSSRSHAVSHFDI